MALVNRILSALLALALAVGALVATAEIVLVALGRPPWLVPHPQWSAWLQEHTWGDTVVRAVLIGLVVVGLLLLIVALRRGKPSSIELPAHGEGVRVTAARRGVERAVAGAAISTGGVSTADASARRRTVKVTANTSMRSPGDLEQRVTQAVTQRLDELELGQRMSPRVSVSHKEAT